jgi:hypothetical protein
MCRAWNAPGYQELERLFPVLRSERRPPPAWHLSRTFFAPRRRVLTCPRCDWRTDIWTSASFHRHDRTNVALVPRVLRVVPLGVSAETVEEAVGWLDERWRGDEWRKREGLV